MRSLTRRALPALPVLFLALPAAAQNPAYLFVGELTEDYLGHSVRAGGDIDGDGVPDLLVGSLGEDDGGDYAGACRVYSGVDGELVYLRIGDAPNDRLGRAVAGLGDLDGDGLGEFAAGASNSSLGAPSAGLVRVYDGSDGGVRFERYGDALGDQLGYQINAAGDVDMDGTMDLVAGAVQTPGGTSVGPGFARVYSGATGAVLWTFTGDALGDQLGYSVDGAGDVNGDGHADLVVGAPFSDLGGLDAGLVRVYSGLDGAVLREYRGDKAGDNLGFSVSGGLDVDGDLVPDFLAGAPNGQTGGLTPGFARVWSGADGTPIWTVYGDDSGDRLGHAVSLMGDADGDGRADLALGADQDDDNGPASGLVRVIAGATGTPLWDLRGEVGDILGWSVDGTGDLNGDGYDDLIAGGWNFSIPTEPSVGHARVYLSQSPVPVAYCTAKSNSLDCAPFTAASGAASLSIADNFVVTCQNALNQKPGLAFWSRGPAALPFLGGTLCCSSPLRRTPVQFSGGSTPPTADCSGAYAFAFTQAYLTTVGVVAGEDIHCQFWMRDPTIPDGTGVALSDAAQFTVVP